MQRIFFRLWAATKLKLNYTEDVLLSRTGTEGLNVNASALTILHASFCSFQFCSTYLFTWTLNKDLIRCVRTYPNVFIQNITFFNMRKMATPRCEASNPSEMWQKMRSFVHLFTRLFAPPIKTVLKMDPHCALGPFRPSRRPTIF